MEHADNIIDEISYIQEALLLLSRQVGLLETDLSPVMNPLPCGETEEGPADSEPVSVLARLQSTQVWVRSLHDELQNIRQNLVVQPQEKKG